MSSRTITERALAAFAALVVLLSTVAIAAPPQRVASSSVVQAAAPEDAPAEGASPEARPPSVVEASSVEEAADAAVREWLARPAPAIEQLAGLDADSLCRELPALFALQAAPAGTQVNVEDRVERTTPEDGDTRVFTYPATRPGGRLDLVEVRLAPEGDGWTTVRVGFRSTTEPSGVRAWLQTREASYGFIAVTAVVVFALFRPRSALRRWLRVTRESVREHKRLVVGTLVALYALFGLGALSGNALPDSCDAAVVEVVQTAVTSLGATAAYGSGEVPRAAAVTFYQNFVVVTLSVTFTLAALLGVPAYLYAGFSFFVQGVPFGMLGLGTGVELLVVLVVLLLELTSYFLVVSGGGMLLSTVWRGGFGQVPAGFRKLLSTLPVALVLLLAGAWFEAAVLVLGF